MYNLSTEYPNTIICMDGNETTMINDRVQIDKHNNMLFTGNTSPNPRTLGRYSKTFQNCHRQKNPAFYTTEIRNNFS